ncbi:MAG: GNAT family N-acetyltransferase [Desulfotalea sp.]
MSREHLIQALQNARKDIEPNQDVTIGLFRPEDAQGVSLAYLETYGDSFPIEHVYDPEEVIRRNETDDQYTVVARTARGEVVGLTGFFRHAPNPDVYESGQLMVLKSYRSSHLARDLCRHAIKVQSQILELPIVFGEAVCNHPVSQRLCIQNGMFPTGLVVECMPAEVYKTEGVVGRNVSLMLLFKIDVTSPCSVCVPEEYREQIQNLYAQFGCVRTLIQSQPLSGLTDKTEFFLPNNCLARITVHKAGTDFISLIEAVEVQVDNNGPVQIYLNMGDPGLQQAVKELRSRGYFYGGLLPHWFGTDGLFMQKVPHSPAWEEIRLYGKKTLAVLELVRGDCQGNRLLG